MFRKKPLTCGRGGCSMFKQEGEVARCGVEELFKMKGVSLAVLNEIGGNGPCGLGLSDEGEAGGAVKAGVRIRGEKNS